MPRAIHRLQITEQSRVQPVEAPRRWFQAPGSLTVLYSAAIAFCVWLLLPCAITDPDIWWHLRDAATQLQEHAFLHRDTYSSTAFGAPWIDHEWLAELPFYFAWRFAGEAGLYLVTLTLLECIFLGLFALSYFKSRNSFASGLVTVAGIVLATVSFGPRTILFGWLLLMVELFILEVSSIRPAILFGLPPLFALWVNVHGSWLIGLALLALFVLSDGGLVRGCMRPAFFRLRQRRPGAVLLLSTAALFLNPYGWRLVAYPFDLAFRQKLNIASIEEWQPLRFQSARGTLFLICLAAIFLCRNRFFLRAAHGFSYELPFLATGTYAAVVHARFLFLAALLVMPLLAAAMCSYLPGTKASNRKGKQVLNAGLLICLLLIAGRIQQQRHNSPARDPFPKAALPFLKTPSTGVRLFNEFAWGGYLEYTAPQVPVFIDSRVDIFERDGVLRDYLAIIRLKNSLALLDQYHIRYVLFERDTPLVYLLQQTKSWKCRYDDGTVILLEHSE